MKISDLIALSPVRTVIRLADLADSSSRDPLPVLLEELLAAARKQLHPLLKYAPAGSVLLLAADHGFKTNLNFEKTDKNALLYLHGGDTLFETLSPWALVRKGL